MILPIVLYGSPILKQKANEISKSDKSENELSTLLENMFETMHNANGVGLAAPQIGLSERIFILDNKKLLDSKKTDEQNIKKVFINPIILEEYGDKWKYEEGCLSIPDISENVIRHSSVKIKYFDEKWNEKTETYDGIIARIIQHEYDHLEGILFIDYLSSIKKKLIKSKLNAISKGKSSTDYKTILI